MVRGCPPMMRSSAVNGSSTSQTARAIWFAAGAGPATAGAAVGASASAVAVLQAALLLRGRGRPQQARRGGFGCRLGSGRGRGSRIGLGAGRVCRCVWRRAHVRRGRFGGGWFGRCRLGSGRVRGRCACGGGFGRGPGGRLRGRRLDLLFGLRCGIDQAGRQAGSRRRRRLGRLGGCVPGDGRLVAAQHDIAACQARQGRPRSRRQAGPGSCRAGRGLRSLRLRARGRRLSPADGRAGPRLRLASIPRA